MSRKPKVEAWALIINDETYVKVDAVGRPVRPSPQLLPNYRHLVEQSPAAAKELKALRALARAATKWHSGRLSEDALLLVVDRFVHSRRQSEGVAL